MNRIEIETKLNEGRNWLLTKYETLSDDQLRRPLTKSEHDPENRWSALDHFAHLALIEGSFNATIQRHFAGDPNPVGLLHDDHGEPRTREQIGAIVHAQTEEWQVAHHDDSYSEVVALTAAARGATLLLMTELSDAQLEEFIPGAPWADGTVGAVLGTNADHGRMHWRWLEEAGVLGTD
ncbi:MAG TPA: DinB family protein [Acidimicrobiales bacterium]|nr:DinB family protein [Acidimicrobiales bacterium]